MPLRGIGGQGELRDQQQAAADIAQRAIHAPFVIGEDAIAEQALEHATDLGLAVAAFDRDESQQASTDAADDFVIDFDAALR